MPLDSTANLLFTIGANSDDAEGNIQAFRALLGKSLGDIGGDFDDWKTKVLGDVSTVEGMLTAGGAAMAAGLVAAGAAAVHCADQYAEYVESVAKASKVTGIAVEDMSRLKFAVEMTGGNFDAMTQGLAKFTQGVVKGAEGSKQQADAFARLGITQAQLQAGEHNMLPLLEAVAEKFQGLKDKTDRTAEARDLFGRGGTQFLNFLALGKEGLKQMAGEADRLGLIVGAKDVEALHAYQAALTEMKGVQEAVDIQVGRQTLPLMMNLKMGFAALIQTMAQGGGPNGSTFMTTWAANLADMKVAANGLAESLARIGKNQLTPPPDAPERIEKVKEAWYGLSGVLEEVKMKLAGATSEEAKINEEMDKLGASAQKALEQLGKLAEDGKLAPGVFERESAAAQEAIKLIPQLYAKLIADLDQKRKVAGDEAHAALMHRLESELEQTREVREAEWNYEIDKLRAEYEQKKQLTAANEALIAAIRKAGMDKIARDQAEADRAATATLETRIAAQSAKTLDGERAAYNAEMDELRRQYAAKYELTAQNEALIAALRKLGLDKISANEKAAYDAQMAALETHLEKIRGGWQTAAERIEATYADDVAHYDAAEEKKLLKTATGEAERARITKEYADIRAALLKKEEQDLQALANSTGWQGVFGAKFGELIRGNEALSREWASSTNQSSMMVRVALEGLEEQGVKTFESLAQGMGSNIASAAVHSKSIQAAMKAELESTLENLAAQGITYAIYSTALGFTRLAQHDAAGAASAFTAAAIWGSVGAAAAVAGRAMAGGASGASGGAGSGASAQTGAQERDAQSGAVPANSQAGGPHVTVNVWGHVVGTSGISEFASMLNDAVLNQDVTLTATNTKTGTQVTR